MADDKRSKTKKDSDSSKTGNSCGLTLGCLVIVVAVATVIFFLFIKPALEEAGYSYDEIKEYFFVFKDKAEETIQKTQEVYDKSRDKVEEIKDTGEDHWETVKETGQKIQEVNDNVQDELDKAAPELVED
jgi:uncharacterized protein YoxC